MTFTTTAQKWVRVLAVAALLSIGAAVGSAAADDGAGHSHGCEAAPATSIPGTDMPHIGAGDASSIAHGVSASQDGYTLVLADGELSADTETEPQFVITGPDGQAVTDFDIVHDKLLHLIIVSRDLVGYAHLHPTLDPEGTWRVNVPPLAAGSYRAFADFVPTAAAAMVLGADLAVPGEFDPAHTPAPSDSAGIDGYDVTFNGSLVAGTGSELTLTVEADGSPVDDLDPYLGALGHLVAIRAGDMAYLHVHPIDATQGPGGPDVPFAVEVPTPGTYRLFFDFSHDGEVHTAAVTFDVSAAVTGAAMDADMHTHQSGTTMTAGTETAVSTMAMCPGHGH